MAQRCPSCGAPQGLPLRRPFWRAGGAVVCRSCFGRSIERELTRGNRAGVVRAVGAVLLLVCLVAAVALLGPHARPEGRRSPAQCITHGGPAC
jgi:hypothetical protein